MKTVPILSSFIKLGMNESVFLRVNFTKTLVREPLLQRTSFKTRQARRIYITPLFCIRYNLHNCVLARVTGHTNAITVRMVRKNVPSSKKLQACPKRHLKTRNWNESPHWKMLIFLNITLP